MYELVDFIVGSLLKEGEKYNVEYIEDDNLINIYVSKDSIGKIIGKQGRIAKAIRTIVKAASIKKNTKVNVEIYELDESEE